MYEDLHLMPGERLLWSGGPERWPVFEGADVLAVPFSVVWCGFAVFWETIAIRSGAPTFFRIWGALFVAVGVYLVVGRLVVRGLQLRSTSYTITDRRLIETIRRPRPRVTEVYLHNLAPPVMRLGRDEATGSIAFGSFPAFSESFAEMGLGSRRWGRSRAPRPLVLRHIAQPRYVRDLVAAAQSSGHGWSDLTR